MVTIEVLFAIVPARWKVLATVGATCLVAVGYIMAQVKYETQQTATSTKSKSPALVDKTSEP